MVSVTHCMYFSLLNSLYILRHMNQCSNMTVITVNILGILIVKLVKTKHDKGLGLTVSGKQLQEP